MIHEPKQFTAKDARELAIDLLSICWPLAVLSLIPLTSLYLFEPWAKLALLAIWVGMQIVASISMYRNMVRKGNTDPWSFAFFQASAVAMIIVIVAIVVTPILWLLT